MPELSPWARLRLPPAVLLMCAHHLSPARVNPHLFPLMPLLSHLWTPSFACEFLYTLHHVPKGARDAWAGIVGDVLWSSCSDPTDIVSRVKFFMLAKCILTTPARGDRSHWHETLKVVRSKARVHAAAWVITQRNQERALERSLGLAPWHMDTGHCHMVGV